MLVGKAPWKSTNPDDLLIELRVDKPVALSKDHSLLGANARALVAALLTRDPRKRLGPTGTRQNGWELRSHPFWWPLGLKDESGWAQLYAKEMPPPFVPRSRSTTESMSNPTEQVGDDSSGRSSSSSSHPYSSSSSFKENAAMAAAEANFGSGARKAALKAVAFPDPSNEGLVNSGPVDGFVACASGLRVRPADLAAFEMDLLDDAFASDQFKEPEPLPETVPRSGSAFNSVSSAFRSLSTSRGPKKPPPSYVV